LSRRQRWSYGWRFSAVSIAARISNSFVLYRTVAIASGFEAGLDPRFDVLEPPLADTLLRRVIRDSFHGLIESEDTDATLFVIDFGLERAKELLRRLTRQRFKSNSTRSPSFPRSRWQTIGFDGWQTEFVPM